MPAFAYEYELAKADGVRFEWYVQPVRIVGGRRHAQGVEFIRTELEDPTSRRRPGPDVPGSEFILPADMIVKALGPGAAVGPARALPDLKLDRGKVVVDPATGATSVARSSSPAATVSAVAARSSTPSRTARSRRGESMPLTAEGRLPIALDRARVPQSGNCHLHVRTSISHRLLRRQGPEPVLAGLRPADQLRVPGAPRLRRRLGRRRLEDHRPRADRQCLVALRRRSTTTAES